MGSEALQGPSEERARLRFRDSVEGRGVTVVPNAVLEDTRLDPATRLAYALLTRHATAEPDAELSTTTLASRLGSNVRQARECLKALVDTGLISIESRRNDGVPTAFCLEPIAARYGGAAAAPAAGGAARGRDVPRDRPGPGEARGAVIPIMTEQRRAYEERLAARIPIRPATPAIDPGLRELGLARSRMLREQLAQQPPGSGHEAAPGPDA
jgi:hypothetical protein